MDKKSIKEELFKYIDKDRNNIISLGESIFKEPELGFKEYKTADKIINYTESCFEKLEKNISLTGFKGTMGTGKGINIAVIAELDAVPTIGHSCASDDGHAAHSCGHSNQSAIASGVVKALYESRILSELNGQVTLIGTPAEEFTDLEYRRGLVDAGKITYSSGKQDMIAKGIFDDVDLIISCHSMGGVNERKADVNSSLNGFLSKKVTYIGKGAHAGARPYEGINALNAAVIGLTAVNTQREAFIDEHKVRVHGIITDGGQSINTVPEKVVIEAYIRGAALSALDDVAFRVDRAFKAGAYAVGGECIIETTPGYLPFTQCKPLSDIARDNLSELIGKENILEDIHSTASGDIGDLSYIKPCIQFGFGGFEGTIHGSDFNIFDEEMAYIIPAKAIAGIIIDLLWNDSEKAKEILLHHSNRLSKNAYIEKWLQKGLF